MSVKEDLIAAREHLAKVGLHKNELWESVDRRGSCPVCSRGAVLIACDVPAGKGFTERAWLAIDAVDAVSPFSNIVKFNDAPSTTLEDVLAVFDKAIEAQP